MTGPDEKGPEGRAEPPLLAIANNVGPLLIGLGLEADRAAKVTAIALHQIAIGWDDIKTLFAQG